MILKSLRIVFVIIIPSINLYSQTTVIQDAKGETSLNWGVDGVLAVSTKDESLSFSYGMKAGESNTAKWRHFNHFGFKAKAKAKSGISNIIKNEDLQFDGSLGIFFFQHIQSNAVVDFSNNWYINADLLLSRFKIFDPSLSFDKQVYDESPVGSKFTIGFNHYNAIKGVRYVFGISGSGGGRNNTEDLKSIGIFNSTVYTDQNTGQVRVVQKDQSTAYEIELYKNNLGYFNLNADLGPQIGKRFIFLLHSRISALQYRKPQFNPAVGLYISKENAPLEAIAGIQVQVLDWYNTAEKDKSKGQRTVLNLVAGFSF